MREEYWQLIGWSPFYLGVLFLGARGLYRTIRAWRIKRLMARTSAPRSQ